MKKTILLRALFLSFLVAGVLSTHAQAYEFDCEKIDEYDDDELWQCKFEADISDNRFIGMDITCVEGLPCFFSLFLGDWDDPFRFTVGRGEEAIVQFHLSNGEILSIDGASGDVESIKLGAHRLRSSKPNTKNPLGSHAMQQLRKYNITKIVVDGDAFTTPGFRSAATIDAICKTLMSHTGDQGQYGAAPATTTSLIASPALPKKMTEVQMVMHPFGVLKKDLSGYTLRQVESDLKKLYKDYVDVWEETSIIYLLHKDSKGYDMTYKGIVPSASCIFQEGRLYSYEYEIPFDREEYTKERVEATAKAFVSALKKGGINLTKSVSGDSYAVSGTYGSRSILVAVHDIEDVPYTIWINISVEN